MNPVAKALWYIESHFAEEITLDDIATICGVSRYHMSRAFSLATGRSIMQYVRGRRLTEAARSLHNGAPDILAVALDAGYNSHEAFTRAFRDQFGRTPELVRAQKNLNDIELMEPIKMDETMLTNLEPPRFENGRTLLIAGLSERYTAETSANIPAQWQRFVPHLGHIPGQIGQATYGVVCNSDNAGNTEYISGVEVSDFARVPEEFGRMRIPEHRYAVFTHRDHISTIRRVWYTIYNQWLPESGYKMAEAPEIERYGPEFNGHRNGRVRDLDSDSGLAQLLEKPIARHAGDLLQRARLFEQVRSSGNDLQFLFALQVRHGLAVQIDHYGIGASDDQERRGFDASERIAGQVRTSAARNDGIHQMRQLGRGHQRSGGSCAGAEQTDLEIGDFRMPDQPFA